MVEVASHPNPKLLVFGGGGAVGRAIMEGALSRRWGVVATTRKFVPSETSSPEQKWKATWITVDPFAEDFTASVLQSNGPYSAVCWANGDNINDSIYTVDQLKHWELYKANCLYIVLTLKGLLDLGLLTKPARLCVISSIWQRIARQNKLSYTMTKSAIQGLVLSLSADLAPDGHLVNAVLPGALDTPMTRTNLLPGQIEQLRTATMFNRLPALGDVVSLVLYLCSPDNTGVTGQFIAADLGFSHVRLI
jgi:NAD(P)-dependent dehydrogenase (short-subunit alcohol dehydrogenase family)